MFEHIQKQTTAESDKGFQLSDRVWSQNEWKYVGLQQTIIFIIKSVSYFLI